MGMAVRAGTGDVGGLGILETTISVCRFVRIPRRLGKGPAMARRVLYARLVRELMNSAMYRVMA